MQFVSYHNGSHDQLALLINGHLYHTDELHPDLTGSMGMMLNYWDDAFPLAQKAEEGIKAGRFMQNRGIPCEEVTVLSPVPFPSSCRRGLAFKNHISALFQHEQIPMPLEFERNPFLTFFNHHSFQGAGDLSCLPDYFNNLDFGLEVAAVICRHGRNIPATHADEYIGGLMILNSFSSRNFPPAEKPGNPLLMMGKNFTCAVGPVMVTLDELENFEIPAKTNHVGKCWNLPMRCMINGAAISEGNLGDMDWTFAELIEHASYGADLYPGDIIASGPVGKGCFLEINAAAKQTIPNYSEQWVKPDDNLQLEVGCLGILRNRIIAESETWSLMKESK